MEPAVLAGLLALVVIVVSLLLKLKAGSGGAAGAKGGKSLKTVVDVEAEADSKPVVRILYGTQTGTAERFSKSLGSELRRKYGDSTTVDVLDIENYKPTTRLAKERLVLFFMATYGDGEPTDNAADFYSWITSEAEAVENGEKEPFMQVRLDGVCCFQGRCPPFARERASC
jgi:NADPH-ferrihemoprotein reductase